MRGRLPRMVDHRLVTVEHWSPARFRPNGEQTDGPGHGKCVCGATSPPYLTYFSIQQWHRDHRQEVAAERRAS